MLKQAEELLGNMDLLPQQGSLILRNLTKRFAFTSLPKLPREVVIAPNLCIPRQTNLAGRLRLGLCLTLGCCLRSGLCFGSSLGKGLGRGLGRGLGFTLAFGLLVRCFFGGFSFSFLGLQLVLRSLPCNSQRALTQALSSNPFATTWHLLGVGQLKLGSAGKQQLGRATVHVDLRLGR